MSERRPYVHFEVDEIERAIRRVHLIWDQAQLIRDGAGSSSSRAYDIAQTAKSLFVNLGDLLARARRNARRRQKQIE